MKKKLKDSATVREIKALLPFYIGGLALMLIICVPLMIGGVGDYTLITGAITGTLISFINFTLLGISAEKSLYMGEKKSQLYMNGSYAVRYIGTFLILGVLMYLKFINPVTALIPLFIPKIGYTVLALKEKSEF
ncbi:MAG: ATP synthase subunit I [Ruminococcaceae bacterium]|nr:ATP synthase subunit I [Oscillospiraceae bacterium]